MRKIYLLGLCVVLVAIIGWLALSPRQQDSEALSVKLVDTGWISDNQNGEGVYMTFQAGSLPTEGLSGFDASIVNLCNQFVGTVVPFVSEKTGKLNPANIVITIKHGGIVGTYGKWLVPYKEGNCSA